MAEPSFGARRKNSTIISPVPALPAAQFRPLATLAFCCERSHAVAMTAESLILPLASDFVGHVEKRLLNELAAAAEEWSECATALTRWEDEHLLENPGADLLRRHKATLERLLRFGKTLSLVVAQPDFPDQRLAAMVAATDRMLQDKLAMWHGKMGSERRSEILQAAFHES